MDRPVDPWEPEFSGDQPALVRPYTLTAGRTHTSVDLPLEAPIHIRDGVPVPSWPVGDARSMILALCAARPSVAEIAAKLAIPLGVARVLIGDLVKQGYLQVHATLGTTASIDDRRDLIGRTLRGLRAL